MGNKPEKLSDIEQSLSDIAEDNREIEVEEPDGDPFKPQKFTLDRQKKFLEELARTGNVSQASRVAGISRASAYSAKESSERLSQLWDEALEIAYDKLEQEARDWAIDGRVSYEKTDPETGEVIERRYDYSESVLIKLLEARRPDEFESSDEGGVPDKIEVEVSTQDTSGHAKEGLDAGD